MALNTRTSALLLAYNASQSVARHWHICQTVNWLQKDRIREENLWRRRVKTKRRQVNLWHPNRAHYMCPSAVDGLLESAVARIRTELALDGRRRRQHTSPTQPRSSRNIRYTVALLMHGNVAHIAEDNRVAVLTLRILYQQLFTGRLSERINKHCTHSTWHPHQRREDAAHVETRTPSQSDPYSTRRARP